MTQPYGTDGVVGTGADVGPASLRTVAGPEKSSQ